MSSSRLEEIRKRLRSEIGEAANHGSTTSRDRFSEISERLRTDVSRKSESPDHLDQNNRRSAVVAGDNSPPTQKPINDGKSPISSRVFCPHCGERLSSNTNRFCPSCGGNLSGEASAPEANASSHTRSLKSIHKVFGNKQLIDKDEFSDPGIPQLPARASCKAICIGMGGYHHYSPLDWARKDACDLAVIFDRLGYQTTLVLDQTVEQLLYAIQNFLNEVNPNDELVITFSGHGAGVNTVPNLTAIDSSGPTDFFDLYKYFIDPARNLYAKSMVVIIDACRNESSNAPHEVDSYDRPKASEVFENSEFGFAILYGASTGLYSMDSPFHRGITNGIFTYCLKDELGRPGQSLHETFRKTRKKVSELMAALDYEQAPALYDELKKDFYFYPNDR